jgi:hypothetical protein
LTFKYISGTINIFETQSSVMPSEMIYLLGQKSVNLTKSYKSKRMLECLMLEWLIWFWCKYLTIEWIWKQYAIRFRCWTCLFDSIRSLWPSSNSIQKQDNGKNKYQPLNGYGWYLNERVLSIIPVHRKNHVLKNLCYLSERNIK